MKIQKKLQKSVRRILTEMDVSDTESLVFEISSKCNVKTTIWRMKQKGKDAKKVYTTKTDEKNIFVWRLK